MEVTTALRIGWRSIGRNRRRTVLTLLAIGFATAVLVFFVALQLSSYSASINATTALFSGHLQVQRAGYLDRPQIRQSFADPRALREAILGLPGVRAGSVRGFGFALLSSAERSIGAQLVGVEPEREAQVSSIAGVIRRGRYLSSTGAEEAVVGASLARNLKVDVGSEVSFVGQARDGSLAAAVVRIVGIFESGSPEFDRGVAFLPFDYFAETFSTEGQAHAIALRLDDSADAVAQEQTIASLINGSRKDSDALVVLRWDELVPGLKQVIELDMASGWLFYVSLVLVVGFTVLNTFLMSVLERTREFGLLLALGARPTRIGLQIILECGLVTVLGLAVGVGMGTVAVTYFGRYGFSVPGSEELMREWNLPATVYPRMSWRAALQGPSVLFATGLLAAVYPALRVLRLVPIKALRAT
ncbi:MAG: ABC transporter permease [Bdellovibrionales bacterium]|nr:ABC transporter permease [Bdellovibrionales bacterium]